jgi:hypothetical protein
MMRRMKEIKDTDKRIVLCQVEMMRNTLLQDQSKDSKLAILESTIHIVNKNKGTFGKVKTMSSLEKNRIALNLLTSVKQLDSKYVDR